MAKSFSLTDEGEVLVVLLLVVFSVQVSWSVHMSETCLTAALFTTCSSSQCCAVCVTNSPASDKISACSAFICLSQQHH